jgi:hypothetical protein
VSGGSWLGGWSIAPQVPGLWKLEWVFICWGLTCQPDFSGQVTEEVGWVKLC